MDHLCVDSMHAGDLGAFQDALGGLFWLEVNHKAWYRRQAIGLAHLNQDLTNFYKANRHLQLSSIVPLSMQQILGKVPGYPMLKAKAAQTRHLAEFGVILA